MRKFALLASVAVSAFMSETCETVVIGGVRYNKSDVDADPEKYGRINKSATEKQEEPKMIGVVTSVPPEITIPPAPSAPDFVNGGNPVAPTVPSPDSLFVVKDGKKYKVVKVDGSHVEDREGIDKAGYATEDAAWTAIRALPH